MDNIFIYSQEIREDIQHYSKDSCSDLCRILRLRGCTKCGGSDFSTVERIFTIGQSPRIWGIFSKYALKLIKIEKY